MAFHRDSKTSPSIEKFTKVALTVRLSSVFLDIFFKGIKMGQIFTRLMSKGHHFKPQNGVLKGKGLKAWAEPPRVKLFQVLDSYKEIYE